MLRHARRLLSGDMALLRQYAIFADAALLRFIATGAIAQRYARAGVYTRLMSAPPMRHTHEYCCQRSYAGIDTLRCQRVRLERMKRMMFVDAVGIYALRLPRRLQPPPRRA